MVDIEKISIYLNRGREDDVSIVCARKYEMVRMTLASQAGVFRGARILSLP